METLRWTARMVSNAPDAETAAIRNYWEQRLVRQMVTVAKIAHPIQTACDVGAGYGRLSCVLREFAEVTAFERDPELLARGQLLNPDVNFVPIEHLTELPVAAASAQFAVTFTVLQHLSDATCAGVLAEIKRVVQTGHVLLVEDTNPENLDGDIPSDETPNCRSRSVDHYCELMKSWQLVESRPRIMEPTFKNQHTGTAMLFGSK